MEFDLSKDELGNHLEKCNEACEKGKKRKMSMTSCGICGTEEAKYRCPGCLKHSCSLECVKKHKRETGCSGIRDKTAFVPLSAFDEINLLSDYRFLEETGRLADSTTRDVLSKQNITPMAKKLISQARRLNITLRILPRTFTKRKENSTFFLWRDKCFEWHLKLIFPQSGAEYTQKRVRDDQTLEAILKSYIHPTDSDPVTRQRLKMYARTPMGLIRVFMRAEQRKAHSLMYHQLDLKKSLKDNLMHKTIIEYPTLHVVLDSHCQEYLTQKQGEVWSQICTASLSKQASMGLEYEATAPVLPHVGPSPAALSTVPTGPPEKKVKRAPLSEDELEEGEILSDDAEEEKRGTNKEEKNEDSGEKRYNADGAEGENAVPKSDDKDVESKEDVYQTDMTDGSHIEDMSGCSGKTTRDHESADAEKTGAEERSDHAGKMATVLRTSDTDGAVTWDTSKMSVYGQTPDFVEKATAEHMLSSSQTTIPVEMSDSSERMDVMEIAGGDEICGSGE